jgi:centractin
LTILSFYLVGYGDRLLNEVKKLALKDIKIKIYAPPERKYSTWIGKSYVSMSPFTISQLTELDLSTTAGGSILSGLSTFKRMWVSSEEWNEDPDISKSLEGQIRRTSM